MKRITGISVVILVTLIPYSCKPDKVPSLTTSEISNITGTSATCGGIITDEGSSTVVTKGVCWSTNSIPIILDKKSQEGEGVGSFSTNMTGLNGITIYYVRAYATNSTGTGYGSVVTFTTLGKPPSATTKPATSVSSNGAVLNGSVNANYLSTIVTFEYGLTTNYDNSITLQSPETGNNEVDVRATITGFSLQTIYHYRIKVVNSLGTSFGSDMTFSAPTTVNDIVGNTYNTVIIGNQLWLSENLKTTKLNDGTTISLVNDNTAWRNISTPGYCYYNFDANYNNPYGALYNWYVVNTGKLCPAGWHVPSNSEWTTLITILGGKLIAGGKLKEMGSDNWLSPNTGASNESGFTGLAGGYRSDFGTFASLRVSGFYWFSDGPPDVGQGIELIWSGEYENFMYLSKHWGLTVRCIKDN